jgi:hypothetical protein
VATWRLGSSLAFLSPSDGSMFHQGRSASDLFGMWFASLAGQRVLSKFEIGIEFDQVSILNR